MSPSPPRWPICRQVQRQAQLMDRMLHVLRIDLAAVVRQDRGKAFAKARTECLHCPESGACEDWLAEPRRTAPPDFCRSAAFFRKVLQGSLGKR